MNRGRKNRIRKARLLDRTDGLTPWQREHYAWLKPLKPREMLDMLESFYARVDINWARGHEALGVPEYGTPPFDFTKIFTEDNE